MLTNAISDQYHNADGIEEKKIAQARSLFDVIAIQFKMNIVKSLMQNYIFFKPT